MELERIARIISNYPLFCLPRFCRSSSAKYKVGRHQLRHNVYDVVVSDTSEEPMKVDVMFDAVEKILLKVE